MRDPISDATVGRSAPETDPQNSDQAAKVDRPDADPEAEQARLDAVLALLDDEKAEDVVAIDLRGKAAMFDFMVIASGRSSRHVGAICEKMIEAFKGWDGPAPRAEGLDNGDWALIDASDIVVHVFRPEVREFYDLEKMWAPKTQGAAP